MTVTKLDLMREQQAHQITRAKLAEALSRTAPEPAPRIKPDDRLQARCDAAEQALREAKAALQAATQERERLRRMLAEAGERVQIKTRQVQVRHAEDVAEIARLRAKIDVLERSK